MKSKTSATSKKALMSSTKIAAPKEVKSASLSSGSGMKDMSVSARKIENGFIVSQSGYSGKGKNQQYVNKEYFSSKNPIQISVSPEKKGGLKFGKKS